MFNFTYCRVRTGSQVVLRLGAVMGAALVLTLAAGRRTAEAADSPLQVRVGQLAPMIRVEGWDGPQALPSRIDAALDNWRRANRTVPPTPEGPFRPAQEGATLTPLPRPSAGEGKTARTPFDDLQITRATSLFSIIPNGFSSEIGEPSAATDGNGTVFMTGNWYAARSSDGGQTFAFVNPYTTFPASDGGFCCDQVVQYIPSIGRFVWLLQYITDVNNENRFRIAVATPGQVASNSWSYTDITSDALGYQGIFMDYPALAVGSDSVFLTFNGFLPAGFVHSTAVRIPLTVLSGQTNSVSSFNTNQAGTLHPAQSVGTDGYIVGHRNSSTLVVYRWPAGSGPSSFTVAHASYNGRNYSSSTPDGFNWLGRVDDRVTGATVTGTELWVGWTASSGGSVSAAQPYAEVARINLSNRTLVSQPRINFGTAACAYITFNTSGNGEVASAFAYGGGGTSFPHHAVTFHTGRYFSVQSIAGTRGPSSSKWGDYFAIRPIPGTQERYCATGFALRAGSGLAAEPIYIEFGRTGEGADSFESDNSAQEAKTLQGTQQRSLHRQDDEDWARFKLTANRTVTVTTAGATGDTELTLFRADGVTQVAFSDDLQPGVNLFSRIRKSLTKGTYRVRVRAKAGTGPVAAYSLRLQ